MNSSSKQGLWICSLGLLLLIFSHALAQPQPSGEQEEGKGELELRKTVKTRAYQGRQVEGEERVVGPGDSLWRILIKEKGLSEKRFHRYLVLMKGLNPDVKRLDVLEVGDTLFIPLRPDEILGIEVVAKKGEARIYRVKRGDYLYKILREQFGLQGDKELFHAAGQVKDLNPRKKNWDLLFVGERIHFPGKFAGPPLATSAAEKAAADAEKPAPSRDIAALGPQRASPPAQAPASSGAEKAAAGIEKPAPPTEQPSPQALEIIGLDYGRKLPVRDHLDLLGQVVGALGNETSRAGEETLPLQEGTVHIDRHSFPIVHNPKLSRKVVLDLDGKMPVGIRTRIEAQGSGTVVVPIKKGASLHEVAAMLLPQLGFQNLPADRPVVVQDRGVGIQVKGEWMVTSPDDSGAKQEMWIISLTDLPGKTPDYLKEYLFLKGMNLKEILLPSLSRPVPSATPETKGQGGAGEIERWPTDKKAMVDAFLRGYRLSFSSDRELSVPLREGIRIDTSLDRLFEFDGKRYGVLFRPATRDLKRALEEKEKLTVIELDLKSLSSRNVITRLLDALGERVAYREHRFPAAEGGAREKVVLTVAGFFLPRRSLLLTDREIPKDLEIFFAEKGLKVIYFQ